MKITPSLASLTSEQLKFRNEKYSVIFKLVANKEKCSVSVVDALHYITNGEKLAEDILKKNPIYWPSPTIDHCRDLIWFMTALSFQQEGHPFPRGTIRVMDENISQLYEFMSKCPDAYERISSHYAEIKEGKQWGINFPAGQLPFKELKHVLFGKLTNPADPNKRDFFYKCETHGCSFWKDPIDTLQHGVNFIKHVFTGGKKFKGEVTHRETDIQELKKSYVNLQEVVKKTFKRRLPDAKSFHAIKSEIDRLVEDLEKRNADNLSPNLTLAIFDCIHCLEDIKERFPNENWDLVRLGTESIIKIKNALPKG